MMSSPLHGRRCIVIAIVILLFLPLTITGMNNALAQPAPSRDVYEGDVGIYLICVNAAEVFSSAVISAGGPPEVAPVSDWANDLIHLNQLTLWIVMNFKLVLLTNVEFFLLR